MTIRSVDRHRIVQRRATGLIVFGAAKLESERIRSLVCGWRRIDVVAAFSEIDLSVHRRRDKEKAFECQVASTHVGERRLAAGAGARSDEHRIVAVVREMVTTPSVTDLRCIACGRASKSHEDQQCRSPHGSASNPLPG